MKLIVGVSALAGVALLGVLLPVRDLLTRALAGVEELGALGPLALAAIWIPACVLLLPGSILTLGAGAVFGVAVGVVAVSVGSTLGASAAFWVGRTLAREWVERKVAHLARFGAIDRAVRREGFKIVFLTRLSPVFPFNLLNYAYGITAVRFRDYVLASWMGMLPGTILYVYLGAAARNLAGLAAGGGASGGTARTVLFAGGLLATAAVVVIVTRTARKAIDRAVPHEQTETR